MTYELSGGWNVAPQVLTRGNGSCSEYTFVFISMCRAAGLPARYVGSVVVRGDDASFDNTFHRWSQVYLPNYGWMHVDPQGGDREKQSEIAASIGQVDNRFLDHHRGRRRVGISGLGLQLRSPLDGSRPGEDLLRCRRANGVRLTK